MRKVTWKYNLLLNGPGSPYRSEVKTLEPGSGAHLGAGWKFRKSKWAWTF